MATPDQVVAIINKHYATFAASVYNDVMLASFQHRPAALHHASTLFFNSLISSQNGQDVVIQLPDDETDNIQVGKFIFSKRHFAKNYKRTFERSVIDYYNKNGLFVKSEQTDDCLTLKFSPIRTTQFVEPSPSPQTVFNPVYASDLPQAPDPEEIPQPTSYADASKNTIN